jgi:hypothetical protein
MVEGVSPAAAFELLAAEPRMDIMQALVAARRNGETPLSFSTLRRQTDIDDSGRFNYHLGKLVGTFVEKDEGGYDLSYAGRAVVAAVIAGTYTDAERKGPEPLDGDCDLCGADLEARYEDGYLGVWCVDDHQLYFTQFPPGAAATMRMETLLEVSTLRIYHQLDLAVVGRCSECFGSLEATPTTADFGDDDADDTAFEEMHVFEMQCDRCGHQLTASAGSFLPLAPSVVAFFRDHGVDIHHAKPWTLVEGERSATVVSESPYRLQFDLEADGDRLRATLDERGRVVETVRPP